MGEKIHFLNQGKRALFENQLIARKKGVISRSKQISLVGVDEGDRKEERRERKVSRLFPKWSTGLQMVNWSSNIW